MDKEYHRLKAKEYYDRNPEKYRERTRKRRADSPEKVKTDHRKWLKNNKEKAKAATTAWRLANKEKIREYNRTQYSNNPQPRLARNRQHYARKCKAGGLCSPAQIEQRIAYYGHVCAYCGAPYKHVDHVIALSIGGSNWPANLRPACSLCNLRKHNMPWRRWFTEIKKGKV